MAGAAKTIEEALAELARSGEHAVRVEVRGLIVELRIVDETTSAQSAAEVFDSIGRWVGDDADEIGQAIIESRRRRGNRFVSGL